MQILEAEKPFDIQEVVLNEWQRRPVKNNFFELVFIKEGTGSQCINYNVYEYSKGSIFLLPPLKCHSFKIKETTKFVFLRFTTHFFYARRQDNQVQTEWFEEAAYILSNYNQLPGDIIKTELDKQHTFTLVDLILKEKSNYQTNSIALIKSFMASILEILLRNIKESTAHEVIATADNDNRVSRLLAYINENLANPKLLKVENLAQTFLLSPTYLSEYFRKKVKMSLREYIIKAKLKRVEIRLLNSDYTLTEIADEMSFTDVSHLSKTFKKYVGLSIRDFKKRGEYQLLKHSSC